MRLGDLIDELSKHDPETPVRFSDGSKPLKFHSWRGVYAQLTLAPAEGREWEKPLDTVGALLKVARAAVGATFQGYKGGDFHMTRSTAVWADGWGQVDHFIIADAQLVDGDGGETLVLTRVAIPSEYAW